jgi:hypothetical protein
MSATEVLASLLVSGLLGAMGQGVRAVVGIKKMVDAARQADASATDLFIASRLGVSLAIGFIAGVIAGLSVGLATIGGSNGDVKVLLGIAAAGYAGTDFIEAFGPGMMSNMPAPVKSKLAGRVQNGVVPNSTAALIPAALAGADGLLNTRYGVTFGALVPKGFFSANPDNLATPRSIRTNNPGALNFSGWQRSRLGYVGITQPDSSPTHNMTTIYRTPEHGVAAWYHMLAVLYFPGGSFTLQALAQRYAGANASRDAIQAYINGWTRWYDPPITPTTAISTTDTDAMIPLAKAMFSHEAGVVTPVQDNQIAFAIERERVGTLPA